MYLWDYLATKMADLYVFVVILFEVLKEKEAVNRTEYNMMKTTERRSLVSIVSLITLKLF